MINLYLNALTDTVNIDLYTEDALTAVNNPTQSTKTVTTAPADNVSISIGSSASTPENAKPYNYLFAGESIPKYRVCYVHGGQAFIASSDMDVSYALSIEGISVNDAILGELTKIQLADKITNDAWNFTKGKPVYLGINGNVTQVVPESKLFCELGRALDEKTLFLDIEEPTNLG